MLIDPTFSALLFDVLNVNLDETRTSAAGPLALLLITRSPLAIFICIVYDLDSGRPCTSRETNCTVYWWGTGHGWIRLWEMVLGIFSSCLTRAHQKGPVFSTLRLQATLLSNTFWKEGLAFGFTHPLLKEPIKTEFISHIPVFFLDLISVIGDAVTMERVMTFCRKLLIHWMFPREIGSKFRSCHNCEELAAATKWKFSKKHKTENK